MKPESTKIMVGENHLKPRELTLGEVESVLESLLEEDIHPVELVTVDIPIPLSAVVLSVGLEGPEPLTGLPPSKIRTLFKQVEAKNPFLAERVNLLAAVGEKILAKEEEDSTRQNPSKISEDRPTGS